MIPKREEFLPTTEDSPKYPESVLNDFSNDQNFLPLSRNLKFVDYQNAQIILIGARGGKDTLTQELGITVERTIIQLIYLPEYSSGIRTFIIIGYSASSMTSLNSL